MIVRHAKVRKGRRVTCSGPLLAALGAGSEVDGTPEELTMGSSQTSARERERLRALCTRSGVPYRGWHAFHYAAETRLAAHASLDNAARHLGHVSRKATRVYAK